MLNVTNTNLFINTNNRQLDAIYNSDMHGIPNDQPISSAKGLSLSDARESAITNSRFLEAGVSMAILDNPGNVGKTYDDLGKSLATVLEPVLDKNSEIGQTNVFFGNKSQSLHDVFNGTLIGPLSSKSDQIGRQPKGSAENTTEWLIDQLKTPMTAAYGEYNAGNDFQSMLTKIKSVSSVGTTVWQLMKNAGSEENKATNQAAIEKMLKPLGEKVSKDFAAKFENFETKTRNQDFDCPISRMRSERPPLVDGQEAEGPYESAADYGLGFGAVRVRADNVEVDAKLSTALGGKDANNNQIYSQINAIPRQGAPIQDLSRPFTLSENEMQKIPAEYERAGLNVSKFIDHAFDHAFDHGTGVNRWQPYGTFAVESNLRNMPSAGAQSGGTCDILLAVNTINEEPIYGNPEIVEPVTLGASAFMNFGAYHTFSETIPIGQSVAKDETYNPSGDTNAQHDGLYQIVGNLVEKHCTSGTGDLVLEYLGAHSNIENTLKEEHPDLDDSYITKESVDHGENGINAMRMPFRSINNDELKSQSSVKEPDIQNQPFGRSKSVP